MTILVGSSVLQAEGADFVEKSFVGDAELFGGASFVPFGFAESGFNLETLDVMHGALGDFLERAIPEKFSIQHPIGHFFGSGARLRQLQILGGDFGIVVENRGALDGVLQFADVAGPGVAAEARESGISDAQLWFGELAAEAFEKMVSKKQDIIAAIAQRRNRDGD